MPKVSGSEEYKGKIHNFFEDFSDGGSGEAVLLRFSMFMMMKVFFHSRVFPSYFIIMIISQGLQFTCQASNFDERLLKRSECTSPADYAVKLAILKLKSVPMEEDPAFLLIAADTVVVCDDQIYGKPKTPERAMETLRK